MLYSEVFIRQPFVCAWLIAVKSPRTFLGVISAIYTGTCLRFRNWIPPEDVIIVIWNIWSPNLLQLPHMTTSQFQILLKSFRYRATKRSVDNHSQLRVRKIWYHGVYQHSIHYCTLCQRDDEWTISHLWLRHKQTSGFILTRILTWKSHISSFQWDK